ncbi:unnamed protein product [Brassicogethes aeneus]|uniref:Uncharacterized protein n=1 Tax=Brassicogethes aeneus TaxID=1431903 RepID=A0A9P0B184_BRAAE|nr:unnamed protein product [Brassicogethes aeneus]
MQFQHCLTKIVAALDEISEWQDSKTASDAHSLIKAVCDSEFLISTSCLNDVLSTTRPLSLLLQAPSVDFIIATDALKNSLNIIETRRKSAEIYFSKLFSKAKNLAQELDSSIEIPRIVKRQKHRANYSSVTAEQYYRKAIFIPLLDYVILDLQERLPKDTLKVFDLNLLMPSVLIEENNVEKEVCQRIESLGVQYESVLGNQVSNLVGEYQVWKEHWKSNNNKKVSIPKSAVEVLEKCNDQCRYC